MNIKKLLRARLVFIFWIALPNLVFAADARCTLSGALHFDPQWIQTINADIQNGTFNFQVRISPTDPEANLYS